MKKNAWLCGFMFLLSLGFPLFLEAQLTFPDLLSERERARVVDEILEDRLDNLLPQLMRREGIDMWILISREYNEDPVMKTIKPSTWLSARRRTIMVYYDKGEKETIERGVERGCLSRSMGSPDEDHRRAQSAKNWAELFR